MPSPETLLFAALVTVVTYSIFGLTGAGSTALALPLLVLVLPLKFTVPLLLLVDLVASLIISVQGKGRLRWDEFGRLVPFLLIGILLGLTLLVQAPERPLVFGLGCFLVAYAGYCLLRKGGPVRFSRIWAIPIGIVGGALSSLFGLGGVLITLYFSGRLTDKAELRATITAGVLLNSATRVVAFGASGLLTQQGVLASAALLLPSMAIGLFVGRRLHDKVDTRAMLRVVYVVLLVAGLSLLGRTLWFA